MRKTVMRECVEFRIREENAAENLPPEIGENVGYGVRKVIVDTGDPLFAEIGRLHRAFRAKGEYFFSGREYFRHYTRRELDQADLFHVRPKRVFEPAGEECGTTYDNSKACPECGAGAPQTSPLFLDGRRIPRNVDFAQTIAGEIVVSERVVEAVRARELTGFELEAVRLSNVGGMPSEYFQLIVVGQAVELDPATRAGEDPFDDDSYGRCPRGDVVGLNLLSEVTVKGETIPQADVMATRQRVGARRGLLRPRPMLLLSPRAWRTIEEAKLKGLIVEVAHLS
jgi:hypothetical protein